jgi:hypothetical protein
VNFTFNPNAPKMALGDTVLWKNDADRNHTVTPNVLTVWPASGGEMSPGKSQAMAFKHAGTYKYHCSIHTSQNMKGSVKFKMSVSPASGTTSTNFTIRVATQNAFTGFTHDVQRRKHGGTFAAWMNTPSQLVIFNPAPSETGTWEFRARYRKMSTGEKTDWSPILTITVN